MLKSLKRMLIILPCMLFGLFLVSNSNALAADAALLDSKKVVVGENSKENTYYFTDDATWEFQAKFSAVKDWDSFLKYRVVRPDGSATDWSGKQYYVNNNGKFIISDYKMLNYNKTVDVASRNSVAEAGTYYVDIKYYGEYLFVNWDQKKDETIKIIVSGSDDSLNTPTATVSYDKTENKYTVDASILKDGVGYSLVTDIAYYFSTEIKDNSSVYNFYKNMEESTDKGELTFTPASVVSESFDGVDNEAYKYVYVIVESGNGYPAVVKYDIENEISEKPSDTQPEQTGDEDDETGLFDYDFGELILLVLVVVLIVSCALIITQKIVDYKKRLY